MKEKITSLVLVLVVAMSMTVGASAASYIPDDVTYQNLNGQQLAIKTYTLLPDQDPADRYEEDFEHDGFLYSMSDIIKEVRAMEILRLIHLENSAQMRAVMYRV